MGTTTNPVRPQAVKAAPWAPVALDAARIGGSPLMLAARLGALTRGQIGTRSTQAPLAEMGMHPATASRALATLESAGLVTVERRPGRASITHLDLSGRRWAPVPLALIESATTPAVLAVWCALWCRGTWSSPSEPTAHSDATTGQLADIAGLSRSAGKAALAELRSGGWITRRRYAFTLHMAPSTPHNRWPPDPPQPVAPQRARVQLSEAGVSEPPTPTAIEAPIPAPCEEPEIGDDPTSAVMRAAGGKWGRYRRSQLARLLAQLPAHVDPVAIAWDVATDRAVRFPAAVLMHRLTEAKASPPPPASWDDLVPGLVARDTRPAVDACHECAGTGWTDDAGWRVACPECRSGEASQS